MASYTLVIALTMKSFHTNSLLPLFASIMVANEGETKTLYKTLAMRTMVTTNCYLAMLGYCLAISPTSGWTAVTLLIILWLTIVRLHFEGGPQSILKERVEETGPIVPSLGYFIPDVYLLIFIVSHFIVIVGMKTGIPVISLIFLGYFGVLSYAYQKCREVFGVFFRTSGAGEADSQVENDDRDVESVA